MNLKTPSLKILMIKFFWNVLRMCDDFYTMTSYHQRPSKNSFEYVRPKSR